MSDYTTNQPLKHCPKCKSDKPATAEYFARDRIRKDGLAGWCKTCRRNYQSANLKTYADRQRKYSLANPDRVRATGRRWSERHAEEVREKSRRWRRTNLERARRNSRQWRKNNPEKHCIRQHLQRARKRGLPNMFTLRDWENCLRYWHNTCAVCGSQLRGLSDIETHADHWIPVTYKGADNPGTVPGNMICLCSPCNLRKGKKLPDDWLNHEIGKQKATKILDRINDYFESTIGSASG